MPTHSAKGLGGGHSFQLALPSWLICHPCSNPCLLLPHPPSLHPGGCGRKGGCPIKLYLPSPRRTRYRVSFCPQAVLLHCLLALTMQVILQKRPKPKAGDWERQQEGQRAGRVPKGTELAFFFPSPHTPPSKQGRK